MSNDKQHWPTGKEVMQTGRCEWPKEPSELSPAPGWVVHGERMTESGKVQHFQTPPEPHSYPEDIAIRMAEEMKELHPSWVWSVVPPNEKGQR